MSIPEQEDDVKRSIGRRFRYFRENHVGLTQAQLATEFGVHQTTVTNIELANTSPRLEYLVHLNRYYKLDTNWMLTGLGAPLLDADLDTHCGESYKLLRLQFKEMAELMQIAEFRQVMLAKMTELKSILKAEIIQYRSEQGQKAK